MKKITAIFLILVLLSCMFTACGSNDNDKDESKEVSKTDTSQAAESSAPEQSDESEEASKDSEVPVIDLGGATYRVLTTNWGNSSITYNGEIIQRDDFDEANADALDIAKYDARRKIEEKYHCTIEGTFTSTSVSSIIYQQIMSGSEEPYHIVFSSPVTAATDASNDYLVNLMGISSLNGLKDSWWDKNAVSDLSIGGKLYFVSGDINTFDNDGTFIMFFNKDLLTDTNPGVDVYTAVKNKEWDLDYLKTLLKNATYDDGDGVMDEKDNWGFGTETYNAYLMVLASGQKIAVKGDDDLPVLTYNTESFFNVLKDVYDLYNSDTVMVANDGRFDGKGFSSVYEETTIKAFRDGRELFYMGGIFNFTNFREIEFEYGFLPVPMYDSETQDRYYHFVSTGNSSVMSIPASFAEDELEDLGVLIQAIAKESKEFVTPVYYEICMKGKDAKSIEDEEMLDIIFESHTYDIGAIFNWGSIIGEIVKTNSPGDYVSRFSAIADSINTAMEDTIDTFENLIN